MATTLKAAVDGYLRVESLARGTRSEHASTLRKWEQWGGGPPIEELRRKDVRELLDWVYERAVADEGTNPGRTANKAREPLRAVLSWAWEQELIDAPRSRRSRSSATRSAASPTGTTPTAPRWPSGRSGPCPSRPRSPPSSTGATASAPAATGDSPTPPDKGDVTAADWRGCGARGGVAARRTQLPNALVVSLHVPLPSSFVPRNAWRILPDPLTNCSSKPCGKATSSMPMRRAGGSGASTPGCGCSAANIRQSSGSFFSRIGGHSRRRESG